MWANARTRTTRVIVPTGAIVPVEDEENLEEGRVEDEPTEAAQPPAVARTTTIELEGPQIDEATPDGTARTA